MAREGIFVAFSSLLALWLLCCPAIGSPDPEAMERWLSSNGLNGHASAADVSSRQLRRVAAAAPPTPGTIQPPTQAVSVCNQSTTSIAATLSAANLNPTRWVGWGAALSWWANYVGGFSQAQQAAIVKLLFEPTGLNFNIVRFNIGGGYNPAVSKQFEVNTYVQWRGMPGYRPGGPTAAYNWTQDVRQRNILLAAKAAGANTFIAYSNSPPAWATISGDVAGNKGGKSNLQLAMQAAFAQYLADVVQHYSTSFGVTFQYLEPFNEPSAKWRAGSGQEGCHFEESEALALLPIVSSALAKNKLTTTLAFNDDWAGVVASWANSLSSTVLPSIHHFQAHGYEQPKDWPTATAAAYAAAGAAAKKATKSIWLSEWGPLGASDGSTDLGLALYLARIIIESVNYMGASAFLYWQPLDPFPFWSLVDIPWTGSPATLSPTTNKKYSVLKQFTAYVPANSFPVSVSVAGNTCSKCIVGFYNPCGRQLSLYVVNQQATDVPVTLSLAGFVGAVKKKAIKVDIVQTSASADYKKVSTLALSHTFSVSFTASGYSLTTAVVQGIVSKTAAQNSCPKTKAPSPAKPKRSGGRKGKGKKPPPKK